jgi:hypothetical protein
MDKARINRVAVYRIGIAGPCSVTPGATSLSPGPRPFDISRRVQDQAVPEICDKADLRIAAGGSRCDILSMTRLTPTEVAAIPRLIRP